MINRKSGRSRRGLRFTPLSIMLALVLFAGSVSATAPESDENQEISVGGEKGVAMAAPLSCPVGHGRNVNEAPAEGDAATVSGYLPINATRQAGGFPVSFPPGTTTPLAHGTANEDVAYTVTWYDSADGSVLAGPEERFGTMGATVGVTEADEAAIAGYTFDAAHSANMLQGAIRGSSTLRLRLYLSADADTGYTVTWFSAANGRVLAGPDNRIGTTGTTVRVTAADKVAIPGYTLDAANGGNVPEGVIAGDGSLELGLYLLADIDTAYTVTWCTDEGVVLAGPETRRGTTDTTVGVTDADREAIPGYSFAPTNAGNVLEGAIAGDGSLELRLYLTADADTKFAVQVYHGLANGAYPARATVSYRYMGVTDTSVLVDPIDFGTAGYRYDTAASNVEDGVIVGNGSLIMRLYFRPDTAQILFDANGAAGAPTGISGVTGEMVSDAFPTLVPVRAGYTFVGWNTMQDGTGILAGSYPARFPPGTTTYYAQWAPEAATISFDANGGSGGYTGISGLTDQAITEAFPTEGPARDGYLFIGWNARADGSGSHIGSYPAVFPAGNTTYYARWTDASSGIVFDANGGTGAPEGIIGNADTPVATTFPTQAPRRNGYTFTGWNTQADGSGSTVASYPPVFPAGVTVYHAQWIADVAEIVFDANGGTGAPDGISGMTEQTISESLPTGRPVRTGYTFEGWSTLPDHNGTTATAYPASFPAGTTTYHAEWSANGDTAYTLTMLNAADGNVLAGPMSRTGTTDTVAGVTASDRQALPGYIFDEAHGDNVLSGVINGDGSLSLRLYFIADTDTRYTVEAYYGSAGETYSSMASASYTYSGTTGTTARANPADYIKPGYMYDVAASNVEEGAVTGDGSLVLRLHCKAGLSEIVFDANGGENAPIGINGATDEAITAVFPPGQPTRIGYTFLDWNSTHDGTGVTIEDYPAKFLPGTTTFYAQWSADRAQLVFDANGGTGSPAGTAGVTDAEIGMDFPITVPSRDGCTFIGWNTRRDGSGDYVSTCPATFPAGTTTYYAQWSADEANIVFDANGGSGAPAVIGGNTDDPVNDAFPTEVPVRAGYTFTGWNTSQDAAGDTLTVLPATFPAGTTTYYAQWSADESQIIFDANGGVRAPAGTSGATDEPVTAVFPTEQPLRDGYTFTGWNTRQDGTGCPMRGYPATFPMGTTTYHAEWTANRDTVYTVIWCDAATGTELKVDTRVGTTDALASVTEADKTIVPGYVFDAANLENSLEGTITGDGGRVLVLFMQPAQHVVTFDTQGGSSATPAGRTVVYGQSYGSLATTSRPGYAFVGWFTQPDGGTQVLLDSIVRTQGDHTLYAHWNAQGCTSYTVNHYIINAAGTVLLADSDIFYSQTDSLVYAQKRTYFGYTYVLCPNTRVQGHLTDGGNLVLSLYYAADRDMVAPAVVDPDKPAQEILTQLAPLSPAQTTIARHAGYRWLQA